jgi:hypothetical protein
MSPLTPVGSSGVHRRHRWATGGRQGMYHETPHFGRHERGVVAPPRGPKHLHVSDTTA